MFLRIYVLRSLIGAQSRISGVITAAINDLMDIKQKEYKLLLLFIKAEVNHLYEGVYRKLFKHKLDIEDYLKSVKAVETEIQSVLEALYARIEDKA